MQASRVGSLASIGLCERPLAVGRKEAPSADGSAGRAVPFQARSQAPVYRHILETLHERICAGVYGPEGKLPSERQLCAEFGVSHMTLRKALLILRERGFIVAEQGKGTFVKKKRPGDSYFSLIPGRGLRLSDECTGTLVSVATRKATGQVASALALAPGDPFVCARFLITCGAVPVAVVQNHLACDCASLTAGLSPQGRTLGELLLGAEDEDALRGSVTVSAVLLPTHAARVLGRPARSSALCRGQLYRETAHAPAVWSLLYLPGDLFVMVRGGHGDVARLGETLPNGPAVV